MRMREEHRIDVGDAVRQRLLAEIGGRIDENLRPVRDVDVDRGTQPPVADVGRPARRAVAADHRHAVRRAGAEKGDLHA